MNGFASTDSAEENLASTASEPEAVNDSITAINQIPVSDAEVRGTSCTSDYMYSSE